MIKRLFEHLKSQLNSPQTESPDSQQTSSPIGQLTTEKIKAIVADLTQAAPTFEEAGFVMQQLEIEIGLLPKIVPQFKQIQIISAEHEAEMLRRLKDRKLLGFILQSLFKSSRMRALLEDTQLNLQAIEISISAPPSVKTIFQRPEVNENDSSVDDTIIVTGDDVIRH